MGFIYLELAVLIFLVSGGFYMSFWAENPAIVFESPLKLDKTIYHPGESPVSTVNFCVYTDDPTTLYRRVVSGDFHLELSPVTIAFPKGCHTVNTQFNIPLRLPDGVYYVDYSAVTQVNVLGDRHTNFKTEEFRLVSEQGETVDE